MHACIVCWTNCAVRVGRLQFALKIKMVKKEKNIFFTVATLGKRTPRVYLIHASCQMFWAFLNLLSAREKRKTNRKKATVSQMVSHEHLRNCFHPSSKQKNESKKSFPFPLNTKMCLSFSANDSNRPPSINSVYGFCIYSPLTSWANMGVKGIDAMNS